MIHALPHRYLYLFHLTHLLLSPFRCVDTANTKITDLSQCSGLMGDESPAPDSSESCNTQPCDQPYYRISGTFPLSPCVPSAGLSRRAPHGLGKHRAPLSCMLIDTPVGEVKNASSPSVGPCVMVCSASKAYSHMLSRFHYLTLLSRRFIRNQNGVCVPPRNAAPTRD